MRTEWIEEHSAPRWLQSKVSPDGYRLREGDLDLAYVEVQPGRVWRWVVFTSPYNLTGESNSLDEAEATVERIVELIDRKELELWLHTEEK